MHRKSINKLLSPLSHSAILLLCCICLLTSANAVSYQEISEVQNRKEQLQKQIDALAESGGEILARKYLIDQKSTIIQDEINTLTDELYQKETEMYEAEKEEKEIYQELCKAIRDDEERGQYTIWHIIFKSVSIEDFLNRIEFMTEIQEYNERVMQKYKEATEKLANEREELVQKKRELEEEQTSLQLQIDAAETLLSSYASTYQGLKDMEKEEEETLKKMEADLREKERNKVYHYSSVVQEGGYIWPTNDTRLITSPFGFRESPGGIGSTNHKGIDIGACYGTNILAAKSGIVVQSGWYGGYGNCVTIQHSNDGDYTRYAHMSSIAVEEGTVVQQGQTIGLVGSTGNSTGPHIHFEIEEGGEMKDPLNYLNGYVKGY